MLVSPGEKLSGAQMVARVIYKVLSVSRNGVNADGFIQLEYMEKRGFGLRIMGEQTENVPNFLHGKDLLISKGSRLRFISP